MKNAFPSLFRSLLPAMLAASFWIPSIRAQQGVLQLSATGQTISYHAGDDGALQVGVPLPTGRFMDQGNGTAVDALTGLMWVTDGNLMASRDPSFDQDRTPGDGDVDWKTALDYVALLNAQSYLGHTDWRLPDMLELRSLVDLSVPDTALATGHPFTDLQDLYWSSTTTESSRALAAGVFLREYYAHANIIHPAGEVNPFLKQVSVYPVNYWSFHMLPVRGPDAQGLVDLPRTGQRYTFHPGDDGDLLEGTAWPTPRLVDEQNGTVTDRLTGLMWTRNANLMLTRDPDFDTGQWVDGAVPWSAALDYVALLNDESYLGYNDWRLPNRNELASLVDLGETSLTLPEGHPFTDLEDVNYEGYYWSSTTRADEPDQAWMVSFWNGMMGGGNALHYAKTYDQHVWPVRSNGQPLPTASIQGQITLDGDPYPRAVVTLSGPVTGSVRTDLNGVFSFTNLPNGTYTIIPQHKYAAFSPNTSTVTLNNDTVTSDFDATYIRAYGWVNISENLFPVGGAAGGCLSDLWFIGNEGWITNSCFFNEIYHTTDGGDTWSVQTPLAPCQAIYMLSADTGFAGGDSGLLNKTTDGGQNWNFHGVAPQRILSIGFSPDASIGFCGGAEGVISEITSTGLTSQSLTYTDWSALSLGSADHGWAVGCFGRKAILENGDWTYYGGAQYFPCFGDIQFTAPDSAWMSFGGELNRLTNGLLSTYYEDTAASIQGVFTWGPQHVWAVTSSGDILHTASGGNDTMTFATDHVDDVYLVDVFAVDEHQAWAIGNNGSIYRYGLLEGFPSGQAEVIDVMVDHQIGPALLDGVARIAYVTVSQDADLTQMLPDIYISAGASIDPPSGVLQDLSTPVVYTVTSENQQVVNSWTITVSQLPVGVADGPAPDLQLSIFPNPGSDRITIRGVASASAELTIFNSLGKVMHQGPLPASAPEIHLQVGDWPAGIYVAQLRTPAAQVAQRLVVD